jgi:hypothetical protein
MLDCEIIYIYILLIVEHNGDVSPANYHVEIHQAYLRVFDKLHGVKQRNVHGILYEGG